MHPSFRVRGSSALQWVIVVAVVGVAAAVCAKLASTVKTQQQELSKARAELKEAEQLREEVKEVARLKAQLREAETAKREAADLPRLRGEIQQLRQEKAQADQLRAEVTHLRAQAQQARQLQSENQALRGQAQQFTQAQQAYQAVVLQRACIVNLKQIDGAVQQWALEYRRTTSDPYVLTDLRVLAFLKGSMLPVCPGGGVYSAGRNVGANPTCNLAGHTL